MSGRRKITLVLKPRDAEDSPRILKNVADTFQTDDIEIVVKDEPPSELIVNTQLKAEIIDAAQKALVKQNELPAPVAESTELAPVEKKKKSNKEWIKELGFESVKVTIQAVIKGLIEGIF